MTASCCFLRDLTIDCRPASGVRASLTPMVTLIGLDLGRCWVAL
jgi:hypothetical protein